MSWFSAVRFAQEREPPPPRLSDLEQLKEQIVTEINERRDFLIGDPPCLVQKSCPDRLLHPLSRQPAFRPYFLVYPYLFISQP